MMMMMSLLKPVVIGVYIWALSYNELSAELFVNMSFQTRYLMHL